MSALESLRGLLRAGMAVGGAQHADRSGIDDVLAVMQADTKSRKNAVIPHDQQLDAVRRFWPTQIVESYRDAYYISWGLCIPHKDGGECVLENTPRLERILECVDEFGDKPTIFRRCYQGLVKSYFEYDGKNLADERRQAARKNWSTLRDYLSEHGHLIRSERHDPDWVNIALANQTLFGQDPCGPYVDDLLRGDSSYVQNVCANLMISQTSWFQVKLVMAQIEKAVRLSDVEFVALLERLLRVELFVNNVVRRDEGMRLLLNRYALIPGRPLHADLRDYAVAWWGNPWLPSNAARWGGVSQEAREMVGNWLKSELIEAFFLKLAEDGFADPRRMNFWKRYVKSMSHIEFALGAVARLSADPDLNALRKKMDGLIHTLEASGTNNAFIMRFPGLVLVEFGDAGAMYGYREGAVPFDTGKLLRLPVDASNSLKHMSKSELRETHHGQEGTWKAWERTFEQKLRVYGILPDEAAGRTKPSANQVAAKKEAGSVVARYSSSALQQFVSENGFAIENNTAKGGSLWVLNVGDNAKAIQILQGWGFKHRPGRGWWR